MLHQFFGPNPTVHLKNVVQCNRHSWDTIIRRAASHRVLPALAPQCRLYDLESHIPADIWKVLTAAETLNAERNQHILAEAVHAAILLNQIGIKPVALKGLALLLTGVYTIPAARYLIDLDFLIPASDIPRAVAHLKHNHYTEVEELTFPDFHHHHAALGRPIAPNIEIHRAVGIGICYRLLPSSEILANAKYLTFNGANFLIPSPTHLANHLILHSQLAHHYSERIFPPLKALIDLAQLQARFANEIDWTTIANTYRENAQSFTLLLHLKQARDIIGLETPITPIRLTPIQNLRHHRRRFLNRYRCLKYVDPIYVYMSLVGRRFQKVPALLSDPTALPKAFRALTRRNFFKP